MTCYVTCSETEYDFPDKCSLSAAAALDVEVIITIIVLACLFSLQRFGTHRVKFLSTATIIGLEFML